MSAFYPPTDHCAFCKKLKLKIKLRTIDVFNVSNGSKKTKQICEPCATIHYPDLVGVKDWHVHEFNPDDQFKDLCTDCGRKFDSDYHA